MGYQVGIDFDDIVLRPLTPRVVAEMSKVPSRQSDDQQFHRRLMIKGGMPSRATPRPIQMRRRPLGAALVVWAKRGLHSMP